MINENEWCYFYLHRDIRQDIFAWLVSAVPLFLPLFERLQAWRQVLISDLVDQSSAQISLLLSYELVWRWGTEIRFEWVS